MDSWNEISAMTFIKENNLFFECDSIGIILFHEREKKEPQIELLRLEFADTQWRGFIPHPPVLFLFTRA